MKILLILLLVGLSCAHIRSQKYYLDKNVVQIETDDDVLEEPPESKKYKADWNDLNTRPLPEWYDKAKIGIFLHWGVFSVPSYEGGEWFWNEWKSATTIQEFMRRNYPPEFSYQEFAPQFHAEFFNANQWALLFKNSGAKYVVLTSKHHDGFTLFPSKRSFGWNAVEVGPKRDLVADVAKACKRNNLTFGVYHSLYEWYNPIYKEDQKLKTNTYTRTKLWPDLKQVITDYKPAVLWSDGDWEQDDKYWNSTGFLAWMYNESPVKDVIVTNDRWGKGTKGKYGDFYNYADRFNPGILLKHKWENAFTIDRRSWGYRRTMLLDDVMTIERLIYEVVSTVSCGGNALINVGPTKEGTIPLIFQERLLSLGEWLSVNGEAIYESSPWKYQNDTLNGTVWYTCRKTSYNALHPTARPRDTDNLAAIYATSLTWPDHDLLKIKAIAPLMHTGNYNVTLLGNEGALDWKITNGTLGIRLPNKATVLSKHAWTLKFMKKEKATAPKELG